MVSSKRQWSSSKQSARGFHPTRNRAVWCSTRSCTLLWSSRSCRCKLWHGTFWWSDSRRLRTWSVSFSSSCWRTSWPARSISRSCSESEPRFRRSRNPCHRSRTLYRLSRTPCRRCSRQIRCPNVSRYRETGKQSARRDCLTSATSETQESRGAPFCPSGLSAPSAISLLWVLWRSAARRTWWSEWPNEAPSRMASCRRRRVGCCICTASTDSTSMVPVLPPAAEPRLLNVTAAVWRWNSRRTGSSASSWTERSRPLTISPARTPTPLSCSPRWTCAIRASLCRSSELWTLLSFCTHLLVQNWAQYRIDCCTCKSTKTSFLGTLFSYEYVLFVRDLDLSYWASLSG